MNQEKRIGTGGAGLYYVVVLAAAGAFYVLTCAPTVLWQDSALYVYRIWHNDVEGVLGLALSHPLYIIIGIAVKYIPVGQLAYKANLMSALFGAIAVANLFLLLRLWVNRTLPAAIGAITLTVSWTFWQHSVMAEVYTLSAALLLAELTVLLQYARTKQVGYLYLLGLFNGLAIANHMWGAISFACYTIFLVVLLARKQIGFRHFAITALVWVIGAAPYEYLIIKSIILSGDVKGTLVSAAFGRLWQGSVLNTSISMKTVLENIIFIALNFPTPTFALFFVGLWVLWKMAPSRSFANILFGLAALHFLFAFRYTVPDRYAFFLPFYCLAAVLIGLGADAALTRYKYKCAILAALVFALLPIPVYSMTPDLARRMYKPLGERRQRPYRDEYKYFLQPWKMGCRGAQRFADEALDMVEETAIIYADSTTVHTLLYAQEVQGKREDVRIVSDYYKGENAPVFAEETIEQLMKNSAVYVVSPLEGYCPGFLLERYKLKEAGVLYKVTD
ncbi:MAG: protein O-mannosyl-transferase family [Planctomycetota bacterium]